MRTKKRLDQERSPVQDGPPPRSDWIPIDGKVPRDEWQVIEMLQQLKMRQREQKEKEDERRKKLLQRQWVIEQLS